MPDTLPVHVNREQLHGLDVPNEFETTGSFDVLLENHGESVHVHLHLDDALSEAASLEATNHYVERESARRVTIDVAEGATVRGKLKVVTAYGATTRYVDLILEEPDEESSEVAVDESLAHPSPEPRPTQSNPMPGTDSRAGLADKPEVFVLGLGGLALALAIVSAVVLDNTIVLLGSLAVLAGVLVATYLLVQ